jgi:hypothetical protein
MKNIQIFLISIWLIQPGNAISQDIHIWEMKELSFSAENTYENAYTEVSFWIDLTGPDFNKRVYGFWDGGLTFRVRVVATAPGEWSWTSGSNQEDDKGLHQKSGSFTATSWTPEEILDNPNRRGFIRATANGHAFEYADGTPFFLSSDTWLAAGSWRLPYSGVDPGEDYQPGPGITFEGLIQYLKKRDYNSINFVACYPNWDMDGKPWRMIDKWGVMIRSSWQKWGMKTSDGDWLCKDMQDEFGNKPFEMSEEIPYCADYNRIIPAYFQSLDKKMQYMSDEGFTPFFEPMRRDHYHTWQAYFNFKESYPRYLQYSGMHLDGEMGPSELDTVNQTLTDHMEKYGPPPFGQPVSALIEGTTLIKLGHADDCPWLNMHSAGNSRARDHGVGPLLEEMFSLDPPYPIANLEPRITGWAGRSNKPAGELPPTYSPRDNYFTRASMYGSVLSGALAGHTHGSLGYDCTTTGEFGGDGGHKYIWESLQVESNSYMQHLRKFILSEGARYQDLELASTDLQPQKAEGSHPEGLDGWSFMMRTGDKRFALLYFEHDAVLPELNNMLPRTKYIFEWYYPVQGIWSGKEYLTTDSKGRMKLPGMPNPETDWAAKLITAPEPDSE